MFISETSYNLRINKGRIRQTLVLKSELPYYRKLMLVLIKGFEINTT